MKVNTVLCLYVICVVFLCSFEFGSSAVTSSRSAHNAKAIPINATKVDLRRNQKKYTTFNSTTTVGPGAKSLSPSRTGVNRPTKKPSLEAKGSKTKGVRQLEIPTNRRKSTNPKKFTTDWNKNLFLETTNGPTKVDLPKPTLRNEKRSSKDLRKQLVCPKENEVKFNLFPIKCEKDKDCNSWNTKEICCNIFGAKSCVGGLQKPLEESTHSPIFGFIPRRCPQRPLAELWWEVKVCETDMDCWPRVCCPDGQKRYCRSSQPELESVPVPVKRSLNYLSEYLECTPAPPPIFDLHPKSCNSTFDCFPNVCCQESGKKHCRPPKKSVLTLMANFLNLGLVKRLTKNLVIK